MKKSILEKAFLMNLILILSILGTGAILSRFYLTGYYLKAKNKELVEIAKGISSGKVNPEQFERLEASYNIGIRVNDKEPRGMYGMHRRMMGSAMGIFDYSKLQELEPGQITRVENRHPTLNIELMNVVTKNSDGELIIISTPISSVKETVDIFNRFYLYLGIASIFVGALISYLFSVKMTRPINDINRIAQNIANLNFREKCAVNSGDELQQLGESVNHLSYSLERNIGELKIANEKLKEDIEKEKRVDELRREFISAASHEIKTPIAIINTYAESLKEGVVDEGEKDYYYDSIIEEGNNISNLVSELLTLMELEDKSKVLKIEDVDLEETVLNEVKRFKRLFEEKKVDIKLKLARGIKVSANKRSMERVMSNFLSNALKYGDENGELLISCFVNRDRAVVEIENSGMQIPDLEMENLWKPFYKLDKSRTRKYGGSGGLGLAVIAGILSKIDGNYGALNTEKGVKFWFDLKKI